MYIFAKSRQVSWSVIKMRNRTSSNQTPIQSFYYWLHGWVILGKLTSVRFGAIKYCIKCSIILCGKNVLKRNQFQAILCQIFPISGDMVESVVSAKRQPMILYSLASGKPGPMGHVNISCTGNSRLQIYNTQSKSDWLFVTQSSVLQADWLIMKTNEQATLNMSMLYWVDRK